MVACTTASIELGTLTRSDLFYIPGHQILARAKTALDCAVLITDDQSRQITKDLIPDALFGLAYHTRDGDRFRFFVIECERATEPATSSNWNHKSWRRGRRQYQAYVVQGSYRDHLQLTAPLLILNVWSSDARLAKFACVTEAELGPTSYQLFQSFDDFGPIWRPPKPNPNLLAGTWQQAGKTDFRIDQA